LLKPDSPLLIHDRAILVEVYTGLNTAPTFKRSEILLPGVFVDSESLRSGDWGIIDHVEVNPTEVEFPEGLAPFAGHAFFRKGEISLQLPLTEDDARRINVSDTGIPSAALPDVCLYYLDLKHLIQHEYAEACHLKNADLRFSDQRREIYRMLGEDETLSYFQMSRRIGFDITRFYK